MGGYDDTTRSPNATVLGGLAEFERHLILSRTAEGRTRMQRTEFGLAENLRRRANGETLTEIAKSFNVSHTTIARLVGG